MKIKSEITGFDKVQRNMKKKEDDFDRGLKQLLKEVTDKMLEESVKRSPIDEGFLEKSHERRLDYKNMEGIVYIASNSPAGDYALYMHEGTYKLGPRSLAKQAGVPVIVGRKFMERAYTENRKALSDYIRNSMKEIVNAK